MDKAKALRIGKALAVLLWALTKLIVVWSLRIASFLLIGWFKLLIFVAFGGMNASAEDERKNESEWWWYQNHSDPMHVYDKEKR